MTVYTLLIGGNSKEFEELSFTQNLDENVIDSWSATLNAKDDTITDGATVEIQRDGTAIFKGIVEDINPEMPNKLVVGGRHVGVYIWRKWTERREDPKAGGYFVNFYPAQAIKFILRRPKSDAVNVQRRVGWGISPIAWVVSTNISSLYPIGRICDRYNTLYWESSVNPVTTDYVKIDLGSAKTICAVRIENRISGKSSYIPTALTVSTSLDDSSYTSRDSITSNTAQNLIFSWSPASARYIKIYPNANMSTHWVISEVYVYETEGAISGITIDNANFGSHDPITSAIDQTYKRVSEAVQEIAELTETSNVTWKYWVDNDGNFYFKQRRGSNKSGTISFTYASSQEKINVKRSSTNKVQRLKVLGKGSGHEQDRNSGDWQGSGEYEKIITDTSLKGATACNAKANILLTDLGIPVVRIQCQVYDVYATNAWGVGDDVTLTDTHTGLSGAYQVTKIARVINSNGETVTLEATNCFSSVVDKLQELKTLFEKVTQGSGVFDDNSADGDPSLLDSNSTNALSLNSGISENSLANSCFEEDRNEDGVPDFWEKYEESGTGTVTLSTTSYKGKQSCKVLVTTASNVVFARSDYIPINKDKAIYIETMYKCSYVGATNNLRLKVWFYDENKVEVGTPVVQSTAGAMGGAWLKATWDITAADIPSTAKYAKLGLGCYTAYDNSFILFDDVIFSIIRSMYMNAGTVATATNAYTSSETEITTGSGFQDIINFAVPDVNHEVYYVSVSFQLRGGGSALGGQGAIRVVVDSVNYPDINGQYFSIDIDTTYAKQVCPVLFFTIPKNIKGKTIYIQIAKFGAYNAYIRYITAQGWGHSQHVHR